MPTLSPSSSEPCVIVIFGASGDLTHRKLIPSLYDQHRQGALPERTRIMGVSRTPMTDDEFRAKLRPSAEKFAAHFDAGAWNAFVSSVHYQPGDGAEMSQGDPIYSRVLAIAKESGILTGSSGEDGMGGAGSTPNILFYLSVAPNLYEPIIAAIGSSGLVAEGKRWCSLNPQDCSWQRIIVEKPFGWDLASAQSLNRALGRVFEEEAIFRIDHYLGKELVQNIAVLRFANSIFEPLWNRDHVDHIQVTANETVGVGTRAGYYDSGTGGALRDMVQSHLLQVLALVAMEPPGSFDAPGIMREKLKLFNSARPINPERAQEQAVFGRYDADPKKHEPAYIREKGVNPANNTETYAAVELHVDNWRWSGVPFYLRSGKKMATKLTEVVVVFKRPPTHLFRSLDPNPESRPANRIVINIAPTEGISLRVDGKAPGGPGNGNGNGGGVGAGGFRIGSATLDMDYQKAFGGEAIEAYGPLILDAIRGDRTLYKHRDEVESSWRICQPFLDSRRLREGIHTYAPGSWGPPAADRLLGREGRQWHNPAASEVR